MLGGFGMINQSDIDNSNEFLKDIFKMKPAPSKNRALDCGAGIGRITKHLLMPIFATVDLVEPQRKFTDKVDEYINSNQPGLVNKLGTIYNVGLQEFTPDASKYDIIWCQWVLGHLRDLDFIAFFRRCASGLADNGIIIIKENVTATDDCCIDEGDSSVTRSLKDIKSLLATANLRIIKTVREKKFIQGLFPVFIISCKPLKRKASS